MLVAKVSNTHPKGNWSVNNSNKLVLDAQWHPICSKQQQGQQAPSKQGDLPSQVLSLRNESLMNGAGQEGDAVPADLITKVLAGHADP